MGNYSPRPQGRDQHDRNQDRASQRRRLGNSYRPSHGSGQQARAAQGEDGQDEHQHRKSSHKPQSSSSGSQERSTKPRQPTTGGAVTKTKRDRTKNPSTRIRSLKNLLNGVSNLPMTVRQEKERELAALFLEQEKKKLAEDGKKNLQKYHFIRFIERQKAERALKRLLRQREACDHQDKALLAKLAKEIHETEVDLNYAKYSPLGEKYISLHPHTESQPVPSDRHELLAQQVQTKLSTFGNEQCNLLNSGSSAKPPMWYQVEEYMLEGQSKLEALRDGKLRAGSKLDRELTAVGSKKERPVRTSGEKSAGMKTTALASLETDDDEDMSDGGFFER